MDNSNNSNNPNNTPVQPTNDQPLIPPTNTAPPNPSPLINSFDSSTNAAPPPSPFANPTNISPAPIPSSNNLFDPVNQNPAQNTSTENPPTNQWPNFTTPTTTPPLATPQPVISDQPTNPTNPFLNQPVFSNPTPGQETLASGNQIPNPTFSPIPNTTNTEPSTTTSTQPTTNFSSNASWLNTVTPSPQPAETQYVPALNPTSESTSAVNNPLTPPIPVIAPEQNINPSTPNLATPNLPESTSNVLATPPEPTSVTAQPEILSSQLTTDSEAAPTDLSHLISSASQTNSAYTPPIIQPETLVVPSNNDNTIAPNVPSDAPHRSLPKWAIGLGVGLLLAVFGASAYFILGIGQQTQRPQTSLPAVEQQTNQLTAPPPQFTSPPVATTGGVAPIIPSDQGGGSFGTLDGGTGTSTTPQATSAAELLRQRQLQTQ